MGVSGSASGAGSGSGSRSGVVQRARAATARLFIGLRGTCLSVVRGSVLFVTAAESPPPDLYDAFDADAIPPGVEGADMILNEIARVSALIDSASQRRLWLLRLYEEHEGAAQHGAPNTEAMLSQRIGVTGHTARKMTALAAALGELPEIDAVLAQAQISVDKAEQLVRIATPETQEAMLELAQSGTGEQIRRVVAATVKAIDAEKPREELADKRCFYWTDLPRGMQRLHGVFFSEEAALIDKGVAEARHRLGQELRREAADPRAPTVQGRPPITDADGLLHMAEDYLGVVADGREARHPGRFEVQLLMRVVEPERGDGAAAGDGSETVGRSELEGGLAKGDGAEPAGRSELEGGLAEGDGAEAAGRSELEGGLAEGDGCPIPGDALRRYTCDAPYVELIESGGLVSMGRRTRRIPASLQRGLLLRGVSADADPEPPLEALARGRRDEAGQPGSVVRVSPPPGPRGRVGDTAATRSLGGHGPGGGGGRGCAQAAPCAAGFE